MTTAERYYVDTFRKTKSPAAIAVALHMPVEAVESYLAEHPVEMPSRAGLAVWTSEAAGAVPSHNPNANPVVSMTGAGASR
jgi:hypothetical protein